MISFPCDPVWLRTAPHSPDRLVSTSVLSEILNTGPDTARNLSQAPMARILQHPRSVGCGLLAISHVSYPFSRQFHRRSRDRAAIYTSCYSAQPISYHGISLKFPNTISAPRDKANRNQCMKEPSRVTVLGKGMLYSVSKTSQQLQRSTPPLSFKQVSALLSEISPDPKYACLHLGDELPTSTLPPSPERNPSAAPAMQKLSASS
jgi:hypothetical protein